jgi:hypothetical protein
MRPSTFAREAARLLPVLALSVLVVRSTSWALQGLPPWVEAIYYVGLISAAVGMSLYLREEQVEQDTSDWVDYRDWKRGRDE